MVCLGHAAVDVVIQGLARQAEEEAIPVLYGRRRQRSEATPGATGAARSYPRQTTRTAADARVFQSYNARA